MRLRAFLIALPLIASTACAGKPEPPKLVVARTACTPASDLMEPVVVPLVQPGEPMAERAARDGVWMRDVAERLMALQRWVRAECQ